MKKRMISILLIAFMLLTLVPVAVFGVDPSIFQANITVGDGPVSCTFKILTEPADGNPGTVQIGDGNRVIDLNSAGDLTIPGNVTVSGTGNTYAVTAIANNAFAKCAGLTGTLALPDSVTTIGKSAFSDCRALTGLTLPAGLVTIEDFAFVRCDGLTGTLTLPAGVTAISAYAFQNCGFSGNLTLPASVATIGSEAFERCSNLTSVTLLSSAAPALGYNSFGQTFYGDTTYSVFVPYDGTGYDAGNWSYVSNNKKNCLIPSAAPSRAAIPIPVSPPPCSSRTA